MEKGFVYILRLNNNKYYLGSATNIDRRLHQHEIGSVKSTKYLRPIKLEFYQEYESINLARIIERRLKKLKRKDYIQKIINDKVIKLGL